jgi:hypothetical protein
MGKSQQWKLAHHASELKYEVNFGNQELSEGPLLARENFQISRFCAAIASS